MRKVYRFVLPTLIMATALCATACSEDEDVSTDPVVDGITLTHNGETVTSSTVLAPGDTVVAKLNITQAGDIYLGQGNSGTAYWTVSYPTYYADSTVTETKNVSYDKIGIAKFTDPAVSEYTFVVLPTEGNEYFYSPNYTVKVSFSMKYSYKSMNANKQLYGQLAAQSASFLVENPLYEE